VGGRGCGDPVSLACRATTIEAMLERLIAHFEGAGEPEP
jgi:hypothetical protein